MKSKIHHFDGELPEQETPLLFVHGAFVGAWCWREHFIPYFQRRGYHCVAVDLRGHGSHAAWLRLQWVGLNQYVDDLEAALDACPSPPVLIAHSMGGYVAQKLLERKPPRLAGLVLMAPASAFSQSDAALRLAWRHPLLCYKLSLGNALPRAWWPWFLSVADVRQLLFSEATPQACVEQVRGRLQHESVLAMTGMLRFAHGPPPPLPCPGLVLGAGEDVITPRELVQQTAAWLELPCTIIREAGHAMMLDAHWQPAAQAILSWLPRATSLDRVRGRVGAGP